MGFPAYRSALRWALRPTTKPLAERQKPFRTPLRVLRLTVNTGTGSQYCVLDSCGQIFVRKVSVHAADLIETTFAAAPASSRWSSSAYQLANRRRSSALLALLYAARAVR